MQIKNLRSGIKNGRWSYLIYQKHKKAREALRGILKKLGFYEYQKVY